MLKKRDLIDAIAALPGGGTLLKEPGCVLNSGWDTVSPGEIYVLGLNPGGNPENFGSIASHIEATPGGPWSCYDESWNTLPGRHPHQLRAKKYIFTLGFDHRDVLATNAYFTTSKDARDLALITSRMLCGSANAFAPYWEVHKLLLSIVRPKLILCLGNSESPNGSSFAALRAAMGLNGARGESQNYRNGKYFVAVAPWDRTNNVFVAGVPHPSRFAASEGLSEFLRAFGKKAGIAGAA